MSSFSDYTEAAVLNHLYGSTTFNKPGKFLALFSAAPSDAGGGTELSATGGYARLALPNMAVSGTNPTLATNGAAIEWPAATAAWSAPVTHIAVFDASSGGNMLAWAPLVVSRTVNTGEVFRVSAGDLDITVDTFAASGSVAGASNLLKYSEQFNAEAWRTTLPSGQPSVVANVSADAQGRQTVDELTPNFAAQSPYVRQHVTGLVVGQTYTFSVELQQGRVNSKLAARLTTNNTLAWSTGASTKAPLTGSLVRHSVTWTQQGSTTAAIMIGATDAAGAGDFDCEGPIRMANAMLNVGSTAAPYVRTGEVDGAANLLTYSEQFNATAWQAQVDSSRLIIAANVSTDAQGNQTVDELTTQQAGSIYVRQHVTGLTIGQTYTFSVELQAGRSGSAQNARLTINNTAAWNTGPSVAYPLTSTLTRRSITWTQQGTTTAALMVGCVDAAGVSEGTCLGTIRMNDAMMNVGAVAAPYLRTGEPDAAPLPAPAPQPGSTWPARIFGVYFEAYMGFRFDRPAGDNTGYPRVETLPSQQYNLIYLFNTDFNADGSIVYPHINTTTREEVQRCRARGQKVMLTLGGAQQDYIYQTPTQAQACVDSVRNIVDQYGGLDGIDFNNYEATALNSTNYPAFLREMRNISGQLRSIYGSNFWFSSPAQPDARFDHPQRRFTRDMIASGHIDLTNPQMYDTNYWKDTNIMSDMIIGWIDDCCAGDASKCIVGFGADYFSPYAGDQNNGDGVTGGGPNNNDNQREWDRIKMMRPGVRGMFGWSHETIWGYGRSIDGIVTSRFPGQRNVWGNRMHPRL